MDFDQKDDTDEVIAAAVQEGDFDAFGELVNRYEAKLKRYGRKFLSVPEDIDDLVQDVFIKVYENIQSFNPSLRFSPWIYRIAHNTFVNEIRRKSKYGLASFDPDVIFPLIPSRETADGDSLEAELKDELETLVDSLAIKYREVIVLHYFEDLSYQEISEILQVPVSTVGVRMNRARSKLKAIFNERNT